jgi:hypothetical protein
MHSYTRLALSLLLVAACGDMPGTGTTSTDAGTDATTAGCASEGGDSSTTDADASTSAGSSSTSDASSGEGSGGGDGSTDEPAPAPSCFGTPCTDSAECLPGLRCMTRPETGEGMCVTTCLAAPICDVEAVSCGAFIPKVAPVECIDGGCFPAVCDVLADCPAGSVACDAGLCY